MNVSDSIGQLRVGLIGAGFIARFHVQAFLSVRHVAIAGVYGPTAARREALAKEINSLELGPCTAFASLEAMLTSARSTRCGFSPRTTRGSRSCAKSAP